MSHQSIEFPPESSVFFKTLFLSANDLIHFASPDGILILINESWIRTLEYNIDEIKGKSIYSFVENNDVERFKEYRQKVLSSTIQNDSIIFSVKTKTGRRVSLEGTITLVTKDNLPIYTTGIFRDITEKLNNEKKLQHYNAQLKQAENEMYNLLVNGPDAIIIIDQEGIIKFWNAKAEKIFGWSFSEIEGKTLTETIVPQEYREAHVNGMKRYLKTGEAHVLNNTIEITALDKNGKQFNIALTISSTTFNNQESFIAFIRDITQQKIIENELISNRSQLETSNQELQNFAFIANHDMKEQIRKIKIFCERISNEESIKLSKDGTLYINKVQKSTNNLIELVDGIYKYSVTKNINITFEYFNLVDVIQKVETDLELIISKKGATILYDSLPEIHGANFLIYQLFYNLISNSLKFSKKDVKPLIKITWKLIFEKDSSPNNINEYPYIEIKVSDNGIGFEQVYAEKIFENFFRLHPKSEFEGTGLGLALCKNIVTKHGGSIWVHSEKDVGSDFFILLPKTHSN